MVLSDVVNTKYVQTSLPKYGSSCLMVSSPAVAAAGEARLRAHKPRIRRDPGRGGVDETGEEEEESVGASGEEYPRRLLRS